MIGSFTLTGQDYTSVSDNITFKIKQDFLTEPTPENLILNLENNIGSISVSVNDTSLTPIIYSLSSSHPNGINEGEILQIFLSTSNVEGPVPYEVSGITVDDLDAGSDPLNGNMVLDLEGDSSLTFKIKKDFSSNEGGETFTLTLTGPNQNIEVYINDTSSASPSEDGELTTPTPANKVPAISDDTQYATLSGTYSNGTVDVFKYNNLTLVYDRIQTIPKPSSAGNNHGAQTSLNSDGTVLAVTDIYGDSNWGSIYIYRRPEGSLTFNETPDQIISNPDKSTGNTFFGHGLGLNSDGSILVANSLKRIQTYQYDGTSYNLLHSLSTAVQFRGCDISADGQKLVAYGPYGNSNGTIRSWAWGGSAWINPVSYTMTTNYGDNMSIAMSNKNLIAVGEIGEYSGTNRVSFLDWDGSTWVPRPDTLETPYSGTPNWTVNQGWAVALSEPKSDGTVTFIDFGGKIYNIPASYNAYLTAPFSVNEGEELVVNLFTAPGVDSGTYPYTISGITADDLDTTGSYAGITGNFVASGGVGSITLKLKQDSSQGEGLENLIISLDDGTHSVTVRVNDTSIIDPSPQVGETLTVEGKTLNWPAISRDGQVRAYATAQKTIEIFNKVGSSWNHSQTVPFPSDMSSSTTMGSVSLSGDGSVMVLGNFNWSSNKGKIQIFRKDSNGSYQTEESFSATSQEYFGWDTAISEDGNTILILSYLVRKFTLYTYNGSSWTLSATYIDSDYFGGVCLTSDGTKIYGVGPANTSSPYVRVFNINGSTITFDQSQSFVPDISFNVEKGDIDVCNDNKLMIISDYAYSSSRPIDIFDYNPNNSTWVRRSESITGNSNSYSTLRVAMTEPDPSTGLVTVVSGYGESFIIPS